MTVLSRSPLAFALVVGVSLLHIDLPAQAAPPQPLPTAHAHNDYLHPRPLLDALEHGFCSVEADVFLVDGELWVAHEPDQLRADRTLERLYLAPLLDRVTKNGGRVYRDGPPLTLLIDFKSAADSTYAALLPLLQRYASILTRTVDGRAVPAAVEVVISGNRPHQQVADAYRAGQCLVGIDGRLTDLPSAASQPWMPLISDRWTAHFQWNGQGEIPADELHRLESIVAQAHAQQKRLRLWATPDRPEMWQVLRRAGVDLINTDDLPGLAAFLKDAATQQ